MQDPHAFLVNLALVLCVAAITTVVFQRLRQPVVLGYLLAGAIVSPHTPLPVFADEKTVHLLSELGVILLMFSLGLEFSLRKLVRVGPTAGLVAFIQCSLMIWLGYLTGQAFGWTRLESLYAGALIAISSTTIIVKAFEEAKVKGKLTEIVFGVLIVEDLIAIFLLAVLSTVSSGESLSAADVAATLGRLGAFLALTIGGGLLVVPPLVRAIIRLDRPETTVVASVGLSFAFALIAYGAGYSIALGAFLAGALVAESGEAGTVEHLVQPIRDMFAAIFFVAVGMLIDPALVAEHWVAIVVLTIVVVLGKLVGVGVGAFLAGEGIRTSVQAGMSLAQIGEFSFIIAGAGLAAGATGTFLYPIAVAVSAVTTLLTPWLIRASDATATFVDRYLPAPVQTFAALYATWVEKIRTAPREPSVGRRVRRLTRLLFVDASAVAAIVIATAVWGSQMAERVGASGRIPADFTWIAVIAAATALAAPFCFGIARCATSLSGILATAALPRPEAKADFADAPRRALVVTLQLAILLVVGIPLVAVTQPFLPTLPGMMVLVAIVVLLGIGLMRSAANLHAHARAGAEAIIEAFERRLARDMPAAAEMRELEALHTLLPGLGTPVPLRIRAGSPVVGKTLGDLRLRAMTGATVLAIVREGEDVVTPSGDDVLRAGDVLAVAGTTAAIDAARQLLGVDAV